MKRIFISVCFLAAVSLAPAQTNIIYRKGWIDFDKNGKKDIYEDSSQPVAKRVADLVKRMTLDEKIGQLWQVDLGADTEKHFGAELRRGEISSCLGSDATVETPTVRNRLQHIVVEHSRLGVPLIFGHDVIHGFRTQFPIPLAESCAWEPELFERTETIAAREAAAAGIDWTFAPMMDLARDPRWGRIAEGFGEDPWLGAQFAAACVRGFQGTNFSGTGFQPVRLASEIRGLEARATTIDYNHVVACLKHFVGYGAAEGGRDYNTTEISDFTLWNFYLPQFKAGVDAGALTVMSAFNLLSGVPASADRATLTDILRDEWKFRGFVVSDYESVLELMDHGIAADTNSAARLALTAGVDMEMISHTYHDTLKTQIEQGTISKKILDEAVRRVLTVKFGIGLFDHPFTDETRWKTAYLRDDALALSRESAAKSCVLLKNENGALPISPRAKKIALIGPLAENAQELVGPWHSRAHTNDLISFADAVRNELVSGAELSIARGCALVEPGIIKVPRDITTFAPLKEKPTGSNEIAEAVALAKNADTVLLALGEPLDWSGEDGSRSDLILPGRQQELFSAIAATGKPVIVVLFNGRPLALPDVQEKARAILEAWYPGTRGAEGVADVLFGDAEPAGRLTTTFPRSVGQSPMYYNHYNTGRPGLGEYKGNYVDIVARPLYPFGFGLAYTTFGFGKMKLSATSLSLDGSITAQMEIKNSGQRVGTAVPQLYLHALAASAGPRSVRELKGFQKILLQPGDTHLASFTLSAKELGYYDAHGNWLVEPGKYQLWIAEDSLSGEAVDFELAR